MDIADRLLAGDRRALARTITLIENGDPEARSILQRLYAHTGHAHIVGVTGAPGSGKSTLVSAMARAYRERNQAVGIIAVDPTSPFTGGALLGDRVRMRDLAGDPGVFIRSMATRGHLGGLARATSEVIMALDAAGYQRILVETVGVGQAEVDIARTAHTTIVVQAPGMGDEVQAIKAGVLEIADVLVINKADRDGVERTESALRMALEAGEQVSHHGRFMSIEPLKPPSPGWRPPILRTVATAQEGISGLVDAVERHAAYLQESGRWHERERTRVELTLREILRDELMALLMTRLPRHLVETHLQQIVARALDPYSAAVALLTATMRTDEGTVG
ncbi:MAG: methylmalonyl Co-A mutase-associated GTPase MeaB [Chloroflexi bacterium]|nr:methylmalonyl Co-A mutase-associated GTPase MeaB [Chloroflexota bacterium]